MDLVDSFSLFLYAFKMQKNDLDTPDGIWKRSLLEPEKNFYFNHVQSFFIKNNADVTTIADESCCVRYELHRDKTTERQKEKLLLFNQLFSRTAQTMPGENKQAVLFKVFTDNSILSPGILYNPLSGIAILSFGFALSKESNNLQNVTDLNYLVRVFGRSDSASFAVLKKEHPAAREQENKISQELQQFNTGRKQSEESQYHYWNIQTLIKILLQDIADDAVTILSPNRLQCFTYLQADEKLNENELHIASFRLRRMYNNHYFPGPHFLHGSAETEQTFEQVHFGASIEGCAMIVNDNKEDMPSFLRNYGVVVKNRYIWSYLLAYYQRLALIEMNDELSHLYDAGQPELEELLRVSSNLSKIELRALFTQVSYFSQHNDFYDFCKRNLKLGEMYGAIKEKLAGVSRIVQEEVEKEEKVKEKKREKKDRLLEVMIAALLIPEIIFEFLSMLEHVFEINFPMEEHHVFTYILFAFASMLLLTLIPFAFRIYKEYYQVARSYIKKQEISDDIGLKKKYTD